MIIEVAIVLSSFAFAVISVLAAGYFLGWGRSFGSPRVVDRVGTAATIVCFGSIALFVGGILIAFAGYALDQEVVTRVGAVMIAISLPLIAAAEHWA